MKRCRWWIVTDLNKMLVLLVAFLSKLQLLQSEVKIKSGVK